MKKVLAFAFLFIVLATTAYSLEIRSTPKGGNWDNPSTWENSMIPSPADTVVIIGKVDINSNIILRNITINEGAELNINGRLFVHQSLILEGKLLVSKESLLKVMIELKRTDNSKIENEGIIEIGE